jgi:DNA-binding Lrp family transcriptional regulator
MIELDAHDRKILAALQDDARLTNAELAERVGLSPSPCWRRVRRLEAEGVIRGYQAMFDQRRHGLGVTVFVSVSIERNDTAAHQAFERAVFGRPEIVACHIIGGQHDFLLQVVAEDLDAYADFALHVLGQLPGVREIHSSFVLKEVKPSLRLPLQPRAAPAARSRRRPPAAG